MNNPTVTPTTFIPYQYQPHAIKINRTLKPDGTPAYYHPFTKAEINTYDESLFDLTTLSLEKLRMVIDMLNEDDYDRFGFVFGSLIRDTLAIYHQTLHHIDNNIGGIYLTRISHAQPPYITDTVIDAIIKNKVKK